PVELIAEAIRDRSLLPQQRDSPIGPPLPSSRASLCWSNHPRETSLRLAFVLWDEAHRCPGVQKRSRRAQSQPRSAARSRLSPPATAPPDQSKRVPKSRLCQVLPTHRRHSPPVADTARPDRWDVVLEDLYD